MEQRIETTAGGVKQNSQDRRSETRVAQNAVKAGRGERSKRRSVMRGAKRQGHEEN
jgi:hypothetical protein